MKRVFAAVVGGKGGCGKSFTAQIAHHALKGPEGLNMVRVIDSDINNSSMAQIHPDTQFAGLRDANDLESSGVIAMAVRDLGSGTTDSVVWDTAAGIEDIVTANVLPNAIARAEKAKVKIVVLRPITTSQYTQDAAVAFAKWAKARGVAVVYVRNLGQGRAEKYFAEWEEFSERLASIPPAVELVLPDLGCWVADEATALGLSLADVALGNFGHLKDKARAVAERKFHDGIQLAVADWLELRCTEFNAAIKMAIDNISAPASATKSKAEK